MTFPPGSGVHIGDNRCPTMLRRSGGIVARSICSSHSAESAIRLHIDAMPCMHRSGVILLGFCIQNLGHWSFNPRPLAPVASSASIACITAIHAHLSSPAVYMSRRALRRSSRSAALSAGPLPLDKYGPRGSVCRSCSRLARSNPFTGRTPFRKRRVTSVPGPQKL
jgi:hypothetical protein